MVIFLKKSTKWKTNLRSFGNCNCNHHHHTKTTCAKLQEKRILKRKCFWRFFGGFAWFVSSWLRAIMLNWNIKEKVDRNRRKKKKKKKRVKVVRKRHKIRFYIKENKKVCFKLFWLFSTFFQNKIYFCYVYWCSSLPFIFLLSVFPSVHPSFPCICCLVLLRSFCLSLCGFLIKVNRSVLDQCNIISLLIVDCKNTTNCYIVFFLSNYHPTHSPTTTSLNTTTLPVLTNYPFNLPIR